MIFDIPIEAKEKIIRTHGKAGEAFLAGLPEKLARYCGHWGLTKCNFYAHSLNLIFTCKSDMYGDVVLKAGVPEDGRLHTEIASLEFYRENKQVCTLYDYTLEDGMLLLERITPGTTLKNAKADPLERTEVFLDIFRNYHLPCDDADLYPTTLSLTGLFERNLEPDPHFAKYKGCARALHDEIASGYARKCLLHGDLNSGNILLHGSAFKVIDPHGFIGDPVFDLSRWLLNELTDAIKENREFNETLIFYISKSLGLPVSLLYRLLLLDAVQTISYHLGCSMTNEKRAFHIKRCEAAHRLYLSSL